MENSDEFPTDGNDLYVPMGLQMCNELNHVAMEHIAFNIRLYLIALAHTQMKHIQTKTLFSI